MTAKMSVKNVDSKGRLLLGAEFANSTVIVNRVHATEVVVTKGALTNKLVSSSVAGTRRVP